MFQTHFRTQSSATDEEPEMDNQQVMNDLQTVRVTLATQSQELQQVNEAIESLKQQLAQSSEREQSLLKGIKEKNKKTRQFSAVMEEYEGTLSSFSEDRNFEKKKWVEQKANLIKVRDETNSHLLSIEQSFNDVHMKYERCKTVIHTYKANQSVLEERIGGNEEELMKQAERYDRLRQHAMGELEKASDEIEDLKKSSQNEILKLQAMLKKTDIQISSLQESLVQKTKNCEELTAICDELINKAT